MSRVNGMHNNPQQCPYCNSPEISTETKQVEMVPLKKGFAGLNTHKLIRLRKEKGLSKLGAALAAGLWQNYLYYVESRRMTPGLGGFRKLCILYDADTFDILSLLNLEKFDQRDVMRFKLACKKSNTTPEAAMTKFMRIFAEEIIKSE